MEVKVTEANEGKKASVKKSWQSLTQGIRTIRNTKIRVGEKGATVSIVVMLQ
jgi:hypothetical protein